MLTALDKVSLSLQAMQLLFLEVSLNLRQPIADQAEDTPSCGEGPAPAECFRAAVSEHSPEGCVSQDSCRLCSRGCSRVPRAVVQSRVPAVPQGLCAGAGTLPPARLSTQPVRVAVKGAAGRRVGGRSPPAGQGRGLLLPQLLPGAGGSQLHCTPECYKEHFARGETRQGFSISCS